MVDSTTFFGGRFVGEVFFVFLKLHFALCVCTRTRDPEVGRSEFRGQPGLHGETLSKVTN
jgi:hypothetical protein